jgi:hypothetical protein
MNLTLKTKNTLTEVKQNNCCKFIEKIMQGNNIQFSLFNSILHKIADMKDSEKRKKTISKQMIYMPLSLGDYIAANKQNIHGCILLFLSP